MTFANNWRKSRGYIGEYPPDFRQLANVLGYTGESQVEIRQYWW